MQNNVSVLISTYNREKYLPHCLESVLRQTVAPDKIVVVDDGSTDGTSEVLERYADRVEYYRKENEGKAKALNFALPFIDSEYLWIMDDDDLCLPDAIESHLGVLNSSEAADFSYSWFYRGYEDPTDLSRLEIYREEKPLRVPAEDLFIRLMSSCFIGHPAIVARTECYRELGGFNEQLYRSQDYEMLLRLARNYRGIYLDRPTFVCRTHSGERGPQNCRVDFSENEKVFTRFNQQFIAPYHESLPLETYVTTEIKALPAEVRERAALLHRAAIMARHSLWMQFFSDLDRVTAERPGGKAPLVPLEKEMLRAAVNYADWHQFSQIDDLLRERQLHSRQVRLTPELYSLVWGAFARQIHRNFTVSRATVFARLFGFFNKVALNSFLSGCGIRSEITS